MPQRDTVGYGFALDDGIGRDLRISISASVPATAPETRTRQSPSPSPAAPRRLRPSILRRPVLDDEHAEDIGRTAGSAPPAANGRFLRPSQDGMRTTDGFDASGSLIVSEFRGRPTRPSPFHPRMVDGRRIQTFGREKLERTVLALQVDRAYFGHHHAELAERRGRSLPRPPPSPVMISAIGNHHHVHHRAAHHASLSHWGCSSQGQPAQQRLRRLSQKVVRIPRVPQNGELQAVISISIHYSDVEMGAGIDAFFIIAFLNIGVQTAPLWHPIVCIIEDLHIPQ